MRHKPVPDRGEQPPQLATLRNDAGYDQLVLALAIPFEGLCEHHAMPVAGTAHIGYLPAEIMLCGANLGWLVDFLSARPRSQAGLTHQIAQHLATHLRPRGVGVVVEAEHSCMAPNCVRAAGPISITSALLGTLRTVPSCRREFFALIHMSR
jgi:GTP cyclohydrolase IA